MKESYLFEYINENEFHKLERSLKKYNMLAYKKLYFDFYPKLKEGEFLGELVSTNNEKGSKTYELKLPTDTMFSKVHGDIKLHYHVYDKDKIVMLDTLTPEDIVKHAYKEWYPCQRTGHTILNLENGKIYGLGIELNQLPLVDTVYIELYSIDWEEDPIEVEELFSPQEYEEYLEFKDDEVCEYTPDIVSDFCQKKGIDENERKIGLLAYKFEKNEQSNYNQWESKILNKYYDVIMDDYNPFKQMDNDF